ncbi:MAG: hypothetical protein R3A44_27325 [Caldilineaceae bacterium]
MNLIVKYVKVVCSAGLGILLTFALWLSLLSPLNASVKYQQTINATMTVIIERVEALDNFDGGIFRSDPDFYALVTIDGEKFTRSEIISDQNVITPNWMFTKEIPLNTQATQTILAKIEIWDSDEEPGNPDDEADLDTDGDRALNLTINLTDCIDARADAIAGNFDTLKNCHESITVEGDQGDHARIRFRVIAETPKDTFVVKNEAGEPIANAEIRHFRRDQLHNTYFTNNLGEVTVPCLWPEDELMAMQLMQTQLVTDTSHAGWHYKTFITSLDYNVQTGEALPEKIEPGQCEVAPIPLIVQKSSPLILYNLVVSTGWASFGTNAQDAGSFLQQIKRAILSTNQIIFDVTDGQFAFDTVTLYHGRAFWDEADIQILPSNYRRPYAIPGGITPARR